MRIDMLSSIQPRRNKITGRHGSEANSQTYRHIKRGLTHRSSGEQVERLAAKCGKSGEPPAQASNEQRANLGANGRVKGYGGEKAYQQTANDVDRKGGPREMPPRCSGQRLTNEVSSNGTHAAAHEYRHDAPNGHFCPLCW